jgi:RNA polymerase sigma-70 factor (ECF subfamily)
LAPSEDVEREDALLVAAAQDGDVRALESLLVRHESKVLRLLRFLGVPTCDREDVAQEIFLRVFRHLAGIDRRKPFAAWLYRVTVNAAQDYRKASGHSARVEQPMAERFDAADGSRGPEEQAGDDGLRRRLEGALSRLSERERAVFILKEIEGLETREIAGALGLTRITVRRHLGLARTRLKLILGNPQDR